MNNLFIFRRDYRIKDNTALNKCIEDSKNIYCAFIFTKRQIVNNDFKSSNAIQFMVESLKDLSNKIHVDFFMGDESIDVIRDLIINNKIDGVYVNADYTPFSVKRDSDIESLVKSYNISFNSFHDIMMHEPGSILTGSGNVYQKFTPFYNTGLKLNVNKPVSKKIPTVLKLKSNFSLSLDSISKYYTSNPNINRNGGRDKALKILKNIKDFKNYEKERDTMMYETTFLSAYLKFGCVSIREVYWAIHKKFGVTDPLIRQLFWRDFYINLGIGNKDVFKYPLKKQYAKIKWKNNVKDFQRWADGETGFPIVDAAMKQLNETGYMHNRGRLITASFLVKTLGINWQWGEKYFATKLVDYDPLINNGNWQWVAGTGADSQPYFRIFNPWTQGETHDPEAKYIKKWIPELKNTEAKKIHQWYKSYDDTYIKPMLDYSASRKKILDMYKNALT